jgi:hypothetical protein
LCGFFGSALEVGALASPNRPTLSTLYGEYVDVDSLNVGEHIFSSSIYIA